MSTEPKKTPANKFSISYSGDEKRLFISDEEGSLYIEMDHDDCDHDQVEFDADKLVKLLNEHWKFEEVERAEE